MKVKNKTCQKITISMCTTFVFGSMQYVKCSKVDIMNLYYDNRERQCKGWFSAILFDILDSIWFENMMRADQI